MAKLFERVSNSIAAGRAAADPNPFKGQNMAALPKTKRYVVALVLGQTIDDVKTAAKALAKIGTEKDYCIILVTDQPEIPFFQIEDCITEYLPSFVSLKDREGAVPAEIYLIRRLEILLRKWEPVQTIPFGETSETLFSVWQKQS